MSDRYAVFGNPISHTKSPFIHGRFARDLGEELTYEALSAPLDGFKDALDAFFNAGGKGINVTVPFKIEAYEAADARRIAADLAGAANCLKLEDSRLIAENFDGVGLCRDVQVNLGRLMHGKAILITGAGGSARGAALPFIESGAASLTIVNRRIERAEAIRDRLADYGQIDVCDYDNLKGQFDMVFNATSSSLSGDLPPLPPEIFETCTLAYDLTYGKGLTPFLALAQNHGATHIADGVGMLVEQAAEAFAWWRGKRPQTSALIEEMTVPLL